MQQSNKLLVQSSTTNQRNIQTQPRDSGTLPL